MTHRLIVPFSHPNSFQTIINQFKGFVDPTNCTIMIRHSIILIVHSGLVLTRPNYLRFWRMLSLGWEHSERSNHVVMIFCFDHVSTFHYSHGRSGSISKIISQCYWKICRLKISIRIRVLPVSSNVSDFIFIFSFESAMIEYWSCTFPK